LGYFVGDLTLEELVKKYAGAYDEDFESTLPTDELEDESTDDEEDDDDDDDEETEEEVDAKLFQKFI
jgi:E1A-binding protein p400